MISILVVYMSRNRGKNGKRRVKTLTTNEEKIDSFTSRRDKLCQKKHRQALTYYNKAVEIN